MKGEHKPLEADGIPTVAASQVAIDRDAAAARRTLARHGALDVAAALGIEAAA